MKRIIRIYQPVLAGDTGTLHSLLMFAKGRIRTITLRKLNEELIGEEISVEVLISTPRDKL